MAGDPTVCRYTRVNPISPQGNGGYGLTTLMPPAALYGANGIRVAPDGRLWICEGLASRISICDTQTGELTTAVPMDGRLRGGDDLDFDVAGIAYVTEFARVVSVQADGSVKAIAEGFSHANGITISPDGRLFVNEFRMDGRLFEIGLQPPHTVRVIAEGLDLGNACDMGPDGRLYMQNVLAGEVYAVDVETGAKALVAEGLKRVSSVKFDPRGRLLCSEADLGVVTAIDLATGARETAARMPHRTIDNLDFDAAGNLYVSNYSTGCILKVTSQSGPDGEILVPPGLVAPSSLAPIGEDTLLVANFTTIVTVSLAGVFEEWAPWGPLSGEEVVRAAAPIDADTVLVLTGGGQLYRARRGEAIADVKAAYEAGDAARFVAEAGATALAVSGGTIFAAFQDGDIRRLGANGRLESLARSPLERITAFAVDGDTVVCADGEAGTIAVLGHGQSAVIEGFDRPSALAILGGLLFVAEAGGRQIVRCDLRGGARQVVASDLAFGSPIPGGPANGLPCLLAWPDGSLLVGCDGDGSIRSLVRQ